jgi:5-(carboxyamino)imidazole ribonucleotide mutase
MPLVTGDHHFQFAQHAAPVEQRYQRVMMGQPVKFLDSAFQARNIGAQARDFLKQLRRVALLQSDIVHVFSPRSDSAAYPKMVTMWIHELAAVPDCASRTGPLSPAFQRGLSGKCRMADPLIGIIMGSTSDWETMRHASETLDALGVMHETRVVSAHRTPKRLYDYAHTAKSRGLKAIIAGAGGAAHLPGMAASMTELPVLGVPVESKALKGMDSLLSIVQMPAGIPVGTLAIGKAGAINAALLAAAMLANYDEALAARLAEWRAKQTEAVPEKPE